MSEVENTEAMDQIGRYYNSQLQLAEKQEQEFRSRADKIIARYRDERSSQDSSNKFNILWSNIETLKPALYSATPKPQIERRYKDADAVARQAAQVLERAISTALDQNDFDFTMRCVVQDYLLVGRGVCRVRYVPEIYSFAQEKENTLSNEGSYQAASLPDETTEFIAEKVLIDYVHWSDFLHSPARNWKDVTWVAFRNYLSWEEMQERFGLEKSNQARSYSRNANKQYEADAATQDKAMIWEIWDKTQKKVLWLVPAYGEGKPCVLETQDDPLGLADFFPCPMPLYATATNDQLMPVPDYVQYQDQAIELDILTTRITNLSRLIRLRGVYDASAEPLGRLLSEYGVDSQLIPVDQWSSLTQKGGLDGVVAWMPIERMVQVLSQLYQARERVKQDLYEITGIADIIRGNTAASETATAQQIKGRFATLRLGERQKEVARFSRDLIRLQAEIMGEHFDAATLSEMSGSDVTPAISSLLKSDLSRSWKIDIETDSTLLIDEMADKSARIEFLTAITGFLKEVAPLVQAGAVPISLAKEMLLFGVRGFRIARELEAAMESIPTEDAQNNSVPTSVGNLQSVLTSLRG